MMDVTVKNEPGGMAPVQDSPLPEPLRSVTPACTFPSERHCWNTNEEIAAILIAFERHGEWQSGQVRIRPASGSMLLYGRDKVRYRKDGYYWKKRRDGKTTREDHMKLKVQGQECIYGCYVHSAILPTFHRRSYWLLQNPDTVLVHYLNVPLSEDSKAAPMPTLTIQPHRDSWCMDQLLDQLNPMFASEDNTIASKFTEKMTEHAIRKIAQKLLAGQKPAEYTCASNCRCEKCGGKGRSKTRNIKPSVSQQLLSYANHSSSEFAGSSRLPAAESAGAASVLVKTGVKTNQHTTKQNARAKGPLILNLAHVPNNNRLIILSTAGGKQGAFTAVTPPPGGATIGSSQLANLGKTAAQMKREQSHKTTVTQAKYGQGSNKQQIQAFAVINQPVVPTAHHNIVTTTTTLAQPLTIQSQHPLLTSSHTIVQPQASLLNHTTLTNHQASTITVPSHGQSSFPIHSLSQAQNSFTDVSDHRRHSEGDFAKTNVPLRTVAKQNTLQRSHTISSPDETKNPLLNHSNFHIFATTPLNHGPKSHDSRTGDTNHCDADTAITSDLTTGQMQVAESDMVVDNLVRELNLKNRPCSQPNNPFQIFSSFNESEANSQTLHDVISDVMSGDVSTDSSQAIPMQTSPTTQLLNHLEDLGDLSFLDSDKLHTDDGLLDSVGQTVHSCITSGSPADNHLSSHTQVHANSQVHTHSAQQHNANSLEQNHAHSVEHQVHANSTEQAQAHPMEHGDHIADITDFCPEWGYTEGGGKVLVTGPWYAASATYGVLFDSVLVPATRVQSGVLKCFCPEHKAGPVRLRVVCDGHVISNSVTFEFREKEEQTSSLQNGTHEPQWHLKSEPELYTLLAHRLQEVDKRLTSVSGYKTSAAISSLRKAIQDTSLSAQTLESQAVECVQLLKERTWLRGNEPVCTPHRLSLLHLAAALGYSRLIHTLLAWKDEKPSLVLDYEIDALSLDLHCCTPLMWACSRGWVDAACVLYSWRPSALSVANAHGKLPLQMAYECGHKELVDTVMQLKAQASLLHHQHTLPDSDPELDHSRHTTPSPHALLQTHSPDMHFSSATNSPSMLNFSAEDSRASMYNAVDNSAPVLMSPPEVSSPGGSSLNESGKERWFTPPKSPLAQAMTSSDEPVFKVPPHLPLHSTPKSQQSVSRQSQALSLNIPNPSVNSQSHLTQGRASDQSLASSRPLSPRSRYTREKPSLDAATRRSKLLKRISVEVLPDYPGSEPSPRPGSVADPGFASQLDPHQVRARSLTLEERNAPHAPLVQDLDQLDHVWNAGAFRKDPMISMNNRDLNSPVMFLLDSFDTRGLSWSDIRRQHTAMETESSCASSCTSASERVMDEHGESGLDQSEDGNQGNQMATLANQIIAAMPERIKLSPSRSDEIAPEEVWMKRDRSSSYDSFSSTSSSADPPPSHTLPVTEDSGISTPLEGIAFDDYRYPDLGTPTSSLSPASSLHSPYVDHFSMDSPPPTAAEFTEYFNAPQMYLEKDFSQLTLSDAEQRKLYEAAKIIQNFYRRYKDRQEQLMKQRQKEVEAVVVIQTYYRRYKQYIYTRKMTQAAVLIQSQFRSYYAQKRFRQSRQAATLIQNRYRAYKEQERYRKRKDAAVLIQQRFRSHYQRLRCRKANSQQSLANTPDKCREGERSRKASSSSHSEDIAHDTQAGGPRAHGAQAVGQCAHGTPTMGHTHGKKLTDSSAHDTQHKNPS